MLSSQAIIITYLKQLIRLFPDLYCNLDLNFKNNYYDKTD